MSQSLMTQRRFLPYFCTQFLGAFNDNVYKNALGILIAYRLVSDNSGILLNIAAVAFILPYFLFGSIAGQIADKYEKSMLIRRIKIAEILIMLMGSLALYLQSVPAMLFILFLMGSQSTFFGPIKYSILPQHLEPRQIIDATSYVEAGTFLAILLGSILGGFMARDIVLQYILMLTLLAIAVVGWRVSCKIPSAAAAEPNLAMSFNIWQSSREVYAIARKDKQIYLTIMAISWFWAFGSIVLTQFPVFASKVLYGDEIVAVSLLAIFSIGIALGSIVCAKLSAGKVEIGFVPIGAFGMSIFSWQLSNSQFVPVEQFHTLMEFLVLPDSWMVMFNMTMIAFSAGMFIVPLYTLLQVRGDPSVRSRVIAANNIINAFFMVGAGIFGACMIYFGYSVLDIFKAAAVFILIAAIYILSVIPHFLLRLIGWVLIHSIYRIKKHDLHHIPEQGPALLVCNHVSFIDPVILLALAPRPARFVMYYTFYELPIARHLFKWLRSIPIGPKRERPNLLNEAMDTISRSLDDGQLVCVFPEGGITKNGEIQKFQPGVEQILKRNPVPVIPLAIRGMWGSWFSRHKGSAMKGLPAAFMKRISVISGPPILPDEANRVSLHKKVAALRGDEK